MAGDKNYKFYALKLCGIIIVIFIIQLIAFANDFKFSETLLLDQTSFIQVWRFVTSIFLHGSLEHLLFNMFALALFGSILEKFIGGYKFLRVFFITGILANLISVNFYPASLGASGAIFGIIGALVLIKPLIMVWGPGGFPMPMVLAAAIWAALDLFGIFLPSNVGNIAHLTGMLFGFIFGFVYLEKKKKSKRSIIT